MSNHAQTNGSTCFRFANTLSIRLYYFVLQPIRGNSPLGAASSSAASSTSQYAAVAAAAAASSTMASSHSRSSPIPHAASVASAGGGGIASTSSDEYPASVQELVMNGFELQKVSRAYDLIG